MPVFTKIFFQVLKTDLVLPGRSLALPCSALRRIAVGIIVCCILSATGALPAQIFSARVVSASHHVILRKKELASLQQRVSDSQSICDLTGEENEDDSREFPPVTSNAGYLSCAATEKKYAECGSARVFRNVPLYILLHSWKTFPSRVTCNPQGSHSFPGIIVPISNQ
jgi:hypothetical protein